MAFDDQREGRKLRPEIPKSMLDFEYVADMSDEEQSKRLREVLRSDNNSIDLSNVHVNFSKDGMCSVLAFYRCYNPAEKQAFEDAMSRKSPLER